ncbi:lipoate protein ligase C-terminal domain-containing protein [Desulfurococcus mucosus]|uniref:lipoate--protein ligase n=1 Tax=Desulfurococcus mucosus (strain ATCC 35584 / DSM 2162 / JCM 9187 / O7/1) TaxID=765177 RepID=E8R7N1_DESM0|nr:lipoate protein ligase C-terminal domain-containing protein [Desulfurococcus mucosus]ADV64526.1 hypothetical protein Desmu_0207 [Desulfurococcus mucosus DSM 2162]
MRFVKTVRGEKTVEIEVEVSDCRIKRVVFSGDFFAYPDDVVEKLEEALKDCGSDECVGEAFKEARKALLIGVEWDVLENEVRNALKTLCSSSPAED